MKLLIVLDTASTESSVTYLVIRQSYNPIPTKVSINVKYKTECLKKLSKYVLVTFTEHLTWVSNVHIIISLYYNLT